MKALNLYYLRKKSQYRINLLQKCCLINSPALTDGNDIKIS